MSESRRPAVFETSDVNFRLPIRVGVLVLLLLAVVLGAVRWTFSLRGSDISPARVNRFAALSLAGAGTPALQSDPDSDLARMRAISARRLHDYGWIDREAGVLHIPVERAMMLYRQRQAGIPEDTPIE